MFMHTIRSLTLKLIIQKFNGRPPTCVAGGHTCGVGEEDDSAINRKMVCKALTATKEFHCEQSKDGRVAVEMVDAADFIRCDHRR